MLRQMAAVVISLALAAVRTGAQEPGLPAPQGDSVLSGVVVDQLGRPVSGAQIALTTLGRSMRTTEAGAFRFDSVGPGRYELEFRRIGFTRQVWTVGVREGGTALLLQVEGTTHVLDPVSVRAARIGVGGVVFDTAHRPLAQVEITLNGGRKVRTNDEGQFFIPTPPGRFLLHARQKGFTTRMMSVVVSRDSGGQVALWMSPATRAAAAREAKVMEDFRSRMLYRNPVWSRLFTREDLNRLGFERLEQMAVAGSGQILPSVANNEYGQCVATVDGIYSTPLWTVDPADIEFAEVYGSKPPRPKRGNLSSGPIVDRHTRPGCPQVYVWLRH